MSKAAVDYIFLSFRDIVDKHAKHEANYGVPVVGRSETRFPCLLPVPRPCLVWCSSMSTEGGLRVAQIIETRIRKNGGWDGTHRPSLVILGYPSLDQITAFDTLVSSGTCFQMNNWVLFDYACPKISG